MNANDIEIIKAVAAANTNPVMCRGILLADLFSLCSKVAALDGKLGSLQNFKAAMLAAHKARHLTLARVDIVAGLDLRTVRESEINGPAGATWHRVV